MAMDYASIGLRIKHARNEKGFTQEKLADMLNISRIQVAYIENGNRGISLELMVDIANALDVPVGELLADNLSAADKIADSDLRYILLDCTTQEESIITKTAKALKSILLEHGV